MGFLGKLCEGKGITIEEFSTRSGLSLQILQQVDSGVKNFFQGKYFQNIKDYFKLTGSSFMLFSSRREKIVRQLERKHVKDPKLCSAYLRKTMQSGDDYMTFVFFEGLEF